MGADQENGQAVRFPGCRLGVEESRHTNEIQINVLQSATLKAQPSAPVHHVFLIMLENKAHSTTLSPPAGCPTLRQLFRRKARCSPITTP